MAIYHLSVKIIGRSAGRSAVAAAAYRSGEKIVNQQYHRVHNYQNKKGIMYSEILLPRQAPIRFLDRSTLWNTVEKIEKGKNAQLVREVEVALPIELSLEGHISLLQKFVQQNFVDKGMCADFSIHDKGDGKPHAHILLTMCAMDSEGLWMNKKTKEYILNEQGQKQYDKQKKTYKCKSIPTTNWDQKENLLLWRENWAKVVNEMLASQDIRIDHRSYKNQGISKIPTIHLGQKVVAMERKGIPTEIGRIYRELMALNLQKEQMEKRFREQKQYMDDKLGKLSLLKGEEKSPTIEMPESILFLCLPAKEAEHELLTLYDTVQKVKSEKGHLKESIEALEKSPKILWRKGQSIQKQYQSYIDCSEEVKKLKSTLKEEEEKSLFLRNRGKVKEVLHSLEQTEKERKKQIRLFKESFGISPENNLKGKREKQQEYKQSHQINQGKLKEIKEKYIEKKEEYREVKETYMDCLVYLLLREDQQTLYEALGNHIEDVEMDKLNDSSKEKKSILRQLEAFK